MPLDTILWGKDFERNPDIAALTLAATGNERLINLRVLAEAISESIDANGALLTFEVARAINRAAVPRTGIRAASSDYITSKNSNTLGKYLSRHRVQRQRLLDFVREHGFEDERYLGAKIVFEMPDKPITGIKILAWQSIYYSDLSQAYELFSTRFRRTVKDGVITYAWKDPKAENKRK